MPPGLEVTLYPVIGLSPFDPGAVKYTIATLLLTLEYQLLAQPETAALAIEATNIPNNNA